MAEAQDSTAQLVYITAQHSTAQTQHGAAQHRVSRLDFQLLLLCRGRIEQVGTAKEILDNPATPFVMNFISDVNQIPSTCQVWLTPVTDTTLAPTPCYLPLTSVAHPFRQSEVDNGKCQKCCHHVQVCPNG